MVNSHLILGMITALINLLRTSNVRIQCAREYFACRKRHYNTLQSTEPNIYVLEASPCVRCSLFPLRDKQIRFFLKFGQGMYVFEETKKSIQMLLEMCIVQNVQTKSVFTEIVVFTTTVKSAKLALTC